MVGIKDPYTRFCFDQALNYFGKAVENELDKIEGSTAEETERKRQQKLDSILNPDGESTPRAGQFADPALLFT